MQIRIRERVGLPIDCGSKSELWKHRNIGLGRARESRGVKGPSSIVHSVRQSVRGTCCEHLMPLYDGPTAPLPQPTPQSTHNYSVTPNHLKSPLYPSPQSFFVIALSNWEKKKISPILGNNHEPHRLIKCTSN